MKDSSKDSEVRKLYEDGVVYITPHMSHKDRNIYKSKTMNPSSGNIPTYINIPANIVPTVDNFYNNSTMINSNNVPPTNYYPNQFAYNTYPYPPYYVYQPNLVPAYQSYYYGNNPNYNGNSNYRNNNGYQKKFRNNNNGNYRNNNYSGSATENTGPYQK